MLRAKYLNGTSLKIKNLCQLTQVSRIYKVIDFSLMQYHLPFPLSKQPVCIKDITPNLQSCERIQDIKASFRCKADVFLSLDSSDCEAD